MASSSSSASTVAANADLVGEILTWLPPKSVLRFKSVCRQWRDLSSTAFFLATHTRRSPHKIVGFLLRDSSYAFNKFVASCPLDNSARRVFPHQSRVLDDLRRIQCSNGLVLFMDADFCSSHRHLWVYNPTTRQWRILPDIEDVSRNYLVLAFEPSRSHHYRVIIAPLDSREIKVYNSEAPDTYESFSIQQAPWVNHPQPWRWQTCFCNGVVYWLDDGDGSLVSFDVERRSVSGPLTRPPMHEDYDVIKLQESRGRLLLFRHNLFRADAMEAALQVLEMASDHSRWRLLHTVLVRDVLVELYQEPADSELQIVFTCEPVLNHSCWLVDGEGEEEMLVVCKTQEQVVAYNLTSRRRYELLPFSNKEHTMSIISACANTLVAP